MGYSGFEGRHYSTFESLSDDLSHAVNLQMLLNALAYKYILSGTFTHEDIPDTPSIESERRQFFFGSAIGISDYNIHRNTGNLFMQKILDEIKDKKSSNRYPGYYKISKESYLKALISILKNDASDISGALGTNGTLHNLEKRISCPSVHSASGKITRGILDHYNNGQKSKVKTPLDLSGQEFNEAAEQYYRDDLRISHYKESITHVKEAFAKLSLWITFRNTAYIPALKEIAGNCEAQTLLDNIEGSLLNGKATATDLNRIARLIILLVHIKSKRQI
jgi:hypothetical protein